MGSVALVPLPRERLLEPPDLYYRLHHDAYGTVIVWEKDTSGDRWVKLQPGDEAIPSILHEQAGELDRFISVNEFHGWRRVDLLKSLRANFVDVDGTDDLQAVLLRLGDAGMPEPSFAVFSGRGLHLYWLLRPTPARARPVWQRVQDRLIKTLEDFRADPAARDCTRVLRLTGSINSKNGARVHGQVLNDVEWDLHSLADAVLGPRRPQPVRVKVQVRSIEAARKGLPAPHVLRGIKARWKLVLEDLKAIAEHPAYRGRIPQGFRDQWLFLATVALSWSCNKHALEDETLRLAQKYTPGLTLREAERYIKPAIERALKPALDERYKFGRLTLWDRIGGLVPDDLRPKLRAILPEAMRRKNKRATDAAAYARRKTKRDNNTGEGHRAGNAEKLAEACLLKAQGVSNREIARRLGVSDTTIRRWCPNG